LLWNRAADLRVSVYMRCMSRPARRGVVPGLLVAVLVGTAGCGDEVGRGVDSRQETGASYDGPLYVEVGKPRPQDPFERVGAAGRVVRCDAFGDGYAMNDGDVYDDGPVADSAQQALESYLAEFAYAWPQDDYAVAAEQPDRVLYTWEHSGVPKLAAVMHKGEGIDGGPVTGWFVESYARCDLAEFPAEIAEDVGVQVWKDVDGDRVATATIQSYAGSEHCDWQQMTFLEVGGATYVGDPVAGLEGFLVGRANPDVALPSDARDTGYSRDGRSLWLSADKARAYVGDPADTDHVELWPREAERIGCA